MKKLKQLFLEQNITWPKLIIFSITCGVITGIIPLIKILDNTSVHNIAVCFEMWIFLAMFIILNSKNPLEAGIKTFIFFLISQPLCYLVQVPFYSGGFGIFEYYPYWAKLTLLTFPAAMIAWYVKKGNWISMIILSFAVILLSFELIEHFSTLIKSFPHQLLAIIFILFETIMFIQILFDTKKKKITMYIISILLLILSITYNIYINKERKIDYLGLYFLENTNTYKIVEIDDKVTAEISGELLKAKTNEPGKYIIKIKDQNNEITTLIFTVTENETNLEKIDNN